MPETKKMGERRGFMVILMGGENQSDEVECALWT